MFPATPGNNPTSVIGGVVTARLAFSVLRPTKTETPGAGKLIAL